MKHHLLLLAAFLLTAVAAVAQDDGLLLHYDFSKVSGTSVSDVSPSGVTATLVNNARVVDLGDYQILDLGSANGYLDMTSKAGDVFKKSRDYSISVYYYIDPSTVITGAGNFVWTFSQNAANEAQSGPYSAYRVNVQRMATSTGGYQNETGMEVGAASAKGQWVHVAYTEASGTGRLYVDGTQVASQTGMPDVTSIFPTTISCCWLGRPSFATDAYLQNTKIADFRYYNRALAESEVTALSKVTSSLERAMVYGNGDATALKAAVADAQKIIDDSASYFLSGTVEDLKDELEVANGVIDAGGYSQYYLDGIADNIATLVQAMRQSVGTEFQPYTNIANAYDTNRGFVHPGGLHTKADFDRVKRQLAEGNEKVTAAYNVLKASDYAQPTVATWPVETIIRGAGAQNYINAARGAAMAYQNGLRYNIEDNKDCGRHAAEIVLQWARSCTGIGGNSNYALAAGLYGYEFAQAAELVRDQFSDSEMQEVRRWFTQMWYPSAMGFLRGRNGTWENAANVGPTAGWGDAGKRPGHYWSNWGLCNALAIISIGIFCDDVQIYNEGMSFFKYDQVGSYVDPRTADPILNDGLTEFLGNLVVSTADTPDTLEASGYGKMGQMQESGRDVGHANMALGLAVDIAHTGWNQGDDLFSYMDNRLAAGIEFTAAIDAGKTLLPWKNYKYVDCRTAWHNGWYMAGPALGTEIRSYWGTIIGHYEGVKGVKMPYSEQCLTMMGNDGVYTGGSSGGYDHLGFSILMNTRDQQLAPADSVPTLLTPLMEYDGQQIAHNELGGLKNTYIVDNNTGLPKGKTVKLMPQLPAGETDTGNWQWNTGETTKDITVTTDKSFVYRATYTNAHGVKSYQSFALAVEGDCYVPDHVNVSASSDGQGLGSNNVTVFYGSSLTLSASDPGGWGTFLWDNGETGSTRATGSIVRERDFYVNFKNHGGAVATGRLHVNLKYMRVQSVVNGVVKPDTTFLLVNRGDNVVIGPYVPAMFKGYTCQWSNGSTERNLEFDNIQSSGKYTIDYDCNGETGQLTYEILVIGDEDADVASGNYYIRSRNSGKYLTRFDNLRTSVQFLDAQGEDGNPDLSQTWTLVRDTVPAYKIQSAKDSAWLRTGLYLAKSMRLFSFYFANAAGTNYYQLHNSSSQYYEVNDETDKMVAATSSSPTSPTTYPLELIPVGTTTAIRGVAAGGEPVSTEYYTVGGMKIQSPQEGVVIVVRRYADGTATATKKVF